GGSGCGRQRAHPHNSGFQGRRFIFPRKAEAGLDGQVIHETKVRVRYAETDKMGVVYHSNFIVWFEIGRVEMLRQLGFRYRDMERDDDCHIAVADVKVRFKAPARYDDEILIRTKLKNVRDSLLQFGYEI